MKKTFVKFCVMQAAYWSFYAAMPSYMSAYMLTKGMRGGTLGILLAAQMGSAFLGSLFWGRFVDRRQASRRFFLLGTSLAAALAVLLYAFADRPAVLFVVYPLFGFMNGPIATTLDSWVIAAMGEVEAGARSRTFGTLGYAFTMLLSGQIIGRFGYQTMPFIGVTLIALAFLIALGQPEARRDGTQSARKGDPAALLCAPRYLLLVAVVFFTGMAIGPINNMKVLVFESVGGDVRFLGWDAFIGCLIQSPFLLLAGKAKGIRAENRLTTGAAFAFLYALLVGMATGPVMVVMGTIATNISFGLLFPTMREITEASVDPSLRTTAHSVVDAAYGSVANMIAAAWGGSVIESAGRGTMCFACMALELIALSFCAALVLRGRGKQSEKARSVCAQVRG